MAVDLSGSIAKELRRAVRRARRLVNERKVSEAADAYRGSAGLARRYAGYALDPATKSSRVETARSYDRMAEELSLGRLPVGVVSDPARNVPERCFGPPNAGEDFNDVASRLISRSPVEWDSIGGLDDVKEALFRACSMATAVAPEGVTLPVRSGILLYGPPGTGKTLLAGAVSNTLDATFFDLRISSVLSKYFGESSKIISSVYAHARKNAPAIVFVDECDALGASRDAAESGAERRLLNSLLTELDGFATKGGQAPVITIAATNAPWLLDEAFVSRLGLRILVPHPDQAARLAILDAHLHRKGYDTDLDFMRLVQATNGFSGRDLAGLCTLAIERMIQAANPGVFDFRSGARSEGQRDLQLRALEYADFEGALELVGRTPGKWSVRHYHDWRDKS